MSLMQLYIVYIVYAFFFMDVEFHGVSLLSGSMDRTREIRLSNVPLPECKINLLIIFFAL